MNVYSVFSIAYTGMLITIPAFYFAINRHFPTVNTKVLGALSIVLYLILVSLAQLLTDTPEHFLVVMSALTAVGIITFLNYFDVWGALYNAMVNYLTRGNKPRKVGFIARNLYYVLFTIILFRGNFYAGTNQFYKLFGISLTQFAAPTSKHPLKYITHNNVTYLTYAGNPMVTQFDLRTLSVNNFISSRAVDPINTRLDKYTGLAIIQRRVSQKSFHWLKLIFKP